jgi:amino acid adenylation domain-containing protein
MTTQIRMGQDPELGLPPGWNDTATPYERDSTIHEVFAQRVAERPDAPAVEDGQQSWTYQELDGLSSDVASRLETLIDGPDQCIGVMADRSIEAVVAILAVLKAGAAFVPLDGDFPNERLRFMAEDTGARAVLAQGHLIDRAREVFDVPVLGLAEAATPGADPIVVADHPVRTPSFGPRSLAYVMYTSGSSGRPKGVAIEHRGVLRYIRGAQGLIPTATDAVLHVSQLGFDASTYEIWGALCNGAKLVVHPHGRPDPRAVAETIERHRVTIGMFSSGLLHQMVDVALASLGSYRLVLSAGDILSPSHARRLREAHPGTRVVNAYGPTEATVTASVYEVGDLPSDHPVPIGHPLPNTELYVLDAQLRPVAGGVGELCIGGDGVARGYLNLPEATAAQFVHDPFGPTPGGRLYRTGDLVRMLPTGELEFLGRLDDQVKIRGYRVEPTEVAAVLTGHPAVAEAVVVAREDIEGHRRLVAYVRAAYDVDAFRLRRYVRNKLPEYMVPSAFVVLDEFPHTANGKVDRAALPAPTRSGTGRPLGTETERTVGRLWARVLESDDVMADDDFFDSGGDSLLALRLLSMVRDATGVDLPLGSVFADRTVAALSARIDNAQPSGTGASGDIAEMPPLVPTDRAGLVPASVVQAQACFLSELADEALPYQSQAVIRFDGPLDEDTLRRVLQALVDRHEVLRTTFPKVRGTWMQQVHPALEVTLPVVDLRSEPDPEAALWALAAERFSDRIAVTELPLVHWTLTRLGDDSRALIWVEHHVVHDGWSFAATLDEMVTLYRAMASGARDPLPALAVQYADFAAWQHAFPATDAGRGQLEYWATQLSDPPPPLLLPTDRPVPPTRTFCGRSLRSDLAPELIDRLRQVASGAGCTPYMVMTAAFFVFLARLSQQTDVVIGSGLANRRLAGSEPLIGMFVNTVALRVDLANDPTIESVLAQVKAASLGALAHQELPFDEVVRALAPDRRPGHNPFYDHLFSFHDSPFPELGIDDLTLTVHDGLSNGSSKADLNVVVINRRGRGARAGRPDGEELSVVWDFATDIFDESTGESMFAIYLQVLAQLVEQPTARLSELTLTTAAERDLLVAAGGTAHSYERDSTIEAVFADRVRERPDAVAVVADGRLLTYTELDSWSDRLAAELTSEGVGPGACVGVVDDRSLSMIVALLGVLKAGAAYVGMDPHLPEARLRRLLSDAAIAVVCTAPGSVPRFDGASVTIVEVDARAESGDDPPPLPHRKGDARALAYVAFTSGSSGEPKGVEVPHRGVVRLVRGTDYVELGPDEVVLAAAPLAFDASTFEIWGALLNGGRLVVAPTGALSTAELADLLTAHRVTTAWLTAGLFHQMVDHQLGALASLRQVLAGGDVLSPPHVNRLLDVLGAGGVVVNGYGPTEGTTFTCCHRMAAGSRVDGRVPIGSPIANTWVAIVDPAGQLVPNGVAGELWIGGDGVARGYAGRPDLTAEQFVPNPFPGIPGGRLYRSGDRVRRRTDGLLEFLGRIDRQAKVRGHRVEPAETEAVLLDHRDIGQAHVVTADFGPDDKRLVAYLVPTRNAKTGATDPVPEGDGATGGPIGDTELNEFLRSVLPSYLVPTAFVWLPRLPLRSNGKIDSERLPPLPSTWFPDDPCTPGVTPEGTQARPVAGASRLENSLIAVWQEVTGVRQIGLHDDFFELGGHSLLAVELFAAIERTTGARLPLATIFEAPTVAQLARLMRSDGWDARTGSLVPLSTTGSRPPFFAVTAGDGNVVGYGPLARRLGPDQPFYVLQPFGLDSAAPLHRTVQAMARHYVRQIRRVQPHGPYLLGGRCFGSLVAYEVATRLEAGGERVALLASIDSVGPLWRTRTLANGTVYDPVMNVARVHAADDGLDLGDVFSDPTAADEFVAWLGEPVTEHGGVIINRYVYAAYLSRPDLQDAFPLGERGDGRAEHAGLAHWAWQGGRAEMGMQTMLLPPPSDEARRARPSVDPRLQTRRRHAADRVLDWLNAATRGSIAPLAARRGADVLRIAGENVARYRAGPLAATVVLIRPEVDGDGLQRAQLARWYGLEVGGVDQRVVAGSHHGMLREPAVASLAECLDQCILAGLEATGPGGSRLD